MKYVLIADRPNSSALDSTEVLCVGTWKECVHEMREAFMRDVESGKVDEDEIEFILDLIRKLFNTPDPDASGSNHFDTSVYYPDTTLFIAGCK